MYIINFICPLRSTNVFISISVQLFLNNNDVPLVTLWLRLVVYVRIGFILNDLIIYIWLATFAICNQHL